MSRAITTGSEKWMRIHYHKVSRGGVRFRVWGLGCRDTCRKVDDKISGGYFGFTGFPPYSG
jgi:hypothetical protein